MKKNKLIKLSIILLLISAVFFSCSKSELTLSDPNNVSESQYYKNETQALTGLAGVYDAYQSGNLIGKRYREFDHITDNATTYQDAGWKAFETDTQNPSSPISNNFWVAYYTVVSRVNTLISAITNMPASSISDGSRNRIVAESSFLRDYAYCDLTALWGNVPLYLKPVGAFADGLASSTVDEVYTIMINDLKTNVIPNLPTTISSSERGRIGQGAAIALLGKYYLYQKDYANASTTFKQIIDSKVYNLYSDYAGLFTELGEFSSESLFEINFTGSSLDNGENFSVHIDTTASLIVPYQPFKPLASLVTSYLCSDGKPIATSTIYGAKSSLYVTATPYINRDPRLRATVFTNADNTPGGKHVWNYSNVNSFAVKKYSTISNIQYLNGGPQNYYVIRYADVLLMYAEAQNEAVGPDANVYAAVNQIRARVKMPAYPVALSQDMMRQYIRDERRWEFALEHQRFFDLQRWGITGPLVTAASTIKLYTTPKDYLWPYPQTEEDRNPAFHATGQNPGY